MKVLIADDSVAIREALCALLRLERDVEVVAEAANGQQALVETGAKKPEVVLMDVDMPLLGGIEATAAIKARWPEVKVVLFTGLMAASLLRRAIEVGADGYLLKGAPQQVMVNALRLVNQGAKVFDGEMWRSLSLTFPAPE